MKKASPMTYRVGSIREFAEWTRRVVRDSKATHGVPKTWFDSEETAERAGAEQVSAEAMVNLAVLAAIRQHQPGSVRELAALTRRKEASLSRTPKRLAQVGIVSFQNGPHRTRMPSLIAHRVHLEIDLTGN